jgi:hypothetical protein
MAGKRRIAGEGLGGAGSGASIEIFSAGVGWSEAAAHGRANQRRRMGAVRPVAAVPAVDLSDRNWSDSGQSRYA